MRARCAPARPPGPNDWRSAAIRVRSTCRRLFDERYYRRDGFGEGLWPSPKPSPLETVMLGISSSRFDRHNPGCFAKGQVLEFDNQRLGVEAGRTGDHHRTVALIVRRGADLKRPRLLFVKGVLVAERVAHDDVRVGK